MFQTSPLFIGGLSIVWTLLATGTGLAGTPSLMRVTTADGVRVEGKLLALDSKVCWLAERTGEFRQIPVSSITGTKKVAPQFTPLTPKDLRIPLKKEFGLGYEVVPGRNYVVVAPPGRARAYAEIFDEVFRSFHQYFRIRGFAMTKPEFPLVAVVFPDRKSFATYARRHGVTMVPGLRGYYDRLNNRVALFDDNGEAVSGWQRLRSERTEDRLQILRTLAGRGHSLGQLLPSHVNAAISGSTIDTLVHEATHQIAYNVGLHSRIGGTPRWIVEGLAMVFEARGIRAGRGPLATRINLSRYRWYQSFREKRRLGKSLAGYIASDQSFKTATLDAYSEAWALTFYLIETRPRDYIKFLRAVTARDPLEPYTAKDRLGDMQAAFGSDLAWLEVNLMRYYDDLAARRDLAAR